MNKSIQEGRLAYKNGVVVGDNPYHEESEEHFLWMLGWAESAEEKQSKNLSENQKTGTIDK